MVITLVLGIGANSAMFSVFNALLLAGVPVPEIDRLVSGMGLYGDDPFAASGLDYLAWREQADSLASAGAARLQSLQLTIESEPRQVSGAAITADYLETLRVQPLLGRAFGPEDADDEAAVVLLGHRLWRAGYGGDPRVVGSSIRVGGVAHEVIGVLPPGFDLPWRAELWLPLSLTSLEPSAQRGRNYFVVGRLAETATLAEARSELEAINARLRASSPSSHEGWRLLLLPLRQQILGDLEGEVRTSLLVLLGAVGMLLLIACVNVSNLLLARAVRRRQELAVRAALGAGRSRLLRQLLTEGLLVAGIGGLAGLLAADWALPLILSQAPVDALAFGDALLRPDLDWRVLGFTLAISVLTGAVLGIVPALRASRTDPQAALATEGRGSTGGAGRLMDGLVVVEIALTVALLVGAGLIGRSFLELRGLDLGFDSRGLLVARLTIPEAAYPDDADRAALVRALSDRVGAATGVEHGGVTTNIPLDDNSWDAAYEALDGRPREPGEIVLIADRRVAGDYMRALGVRLLRGRLLDARDRADTQPVAVVTADLAEREWPGQDPLGRQIRRLSPSDDAPWRTVVGVVMPVKEDASAYRRDRPAWYVPYAQEPGPRNLAVVLRTSGDPLAAVPAVREALRELDPEIPLHDVTTMRDFVRGFLGDDRFRTTLVASFATLALVLAGLGIYGVIAYAVAGQQREIGLRMALGADRSSVRRGVLTRGLRLGAIGAIPGLLAGVLLGRALSSLTFRVSWADPVVLAGAVAICLAVTVTAAWLPARRAIAVDPAVALRPDGGLRSLLLLVPILAWTPAAIAQLAPPPPACEEIEGFHKLDFWVGEWDVVGPDGTPQGSNRIEKILAGCAILEHWEGAGGSTGKSIFYYNHLTDTWKQVWVTSRATATGGVKEKELIEELPDGGVRFQGTIALPDGSSVLDRTTLTPLPDGRVRQVIEYSSDGGEQWNPLFTGIYEPRQSGVPEGHAGVDAGDTPGR